MESDGDLLIGDGVVLAAVEVVPLDGGVKDNRSRGLAPETVSSGIRGRRLDSGDPHGRVAVSFLAEHPERGAGRRAPAFKDAEGTVSCDHAPSAGPCLLG